MKGVTSTSPVLVQTSAALGTIAFSNGVWLITHSAAASSMEEFQLSTGFCLQDLTNDSSYAALYQLYKIKKVVVRIIPYAFHVQNQSTSGSFGVILHSATDSNDAATATIAQLQRYKDYKNRQISSNTHQFKRTIRPRIDVDTQTSGGSSMVMSMKSGWLNTTSLDVDHNALKMAFEYYSSGATTFAFKMELEYHILFKDPQ